MLGKMKITCIMPTAGRLELAKKAIRYFQAQDYEDRTMVIYDDSGHDADLHNVASADKRIEYVWRHSSRDQSIGELRNACCDIAPGELIAHWDDDDYSAPHRLTQQVTMLRNARAAGVDLVGYKSMLFFDERTRQKRLFRYDSQNPLYAIGTSFLYKKSLWRAHSFEPISVGEDNHFLDHATVVTGDSVRDRVMVARIHHGTTSPKVTEASTYTDLTTDGELFAAVAQLLR